MDIYVGNLPYDTEESMLRSEFEAFGTVENVKIVIDHETGRSKGFAFVSMSDQEQAKNAIAELNGKDVNGRAMKVNEARPREERPPRGPGGGGRGFGGGGGRGFGGPRGGGGGGNRGRGGHSGGGRGGFSRGGDPDWR